MKRFVFRLEAVLRHREILETLREQDFATAQGQVQLAESRIAVLNEEIQTMMRGRQGGRAGETFDATDALNRERYLATLQQGLGQLQMHLAAAQVVAAEMRRGLVEARQARQAVSKLREQDYANYMALGLKTEQDTLDEMAGTAARTQHRFFGRPRNEGGSVAQYGKQCSIGHGTDSGNRGASGVPASTAAGAADKGQYSREDRAFGSLFHTAGKGRRKPANPASGNRRGAVFAGNRKSGGTVCDEKRD